MPSANSAESAARNRAREHRFTTAGVNVHNHRAMRALLVVSAAALGCAHAAPPATPGTPRSPADDAEPALAAWRDAIAKNDAHAAYRLLSSSLRARVSENDFALQWRSAHADLSAQKDALQAAHALRHATGELADGRAWPLVRERDRWRVAAVHPLSPGGDTPDDVVRRLVHALSSGSSSGERALEGGGFQLSSTVKFCVRLLPRPPVPRPGDCRHRPSVTPPIVWRIGGVSNATLRRRRADLSQLALGPLLAAAVQPLETTSQSSYLMTSA
ncbi:MAG: hypothetical protein LC659_03340 [Myxococcales bacterium]|nr:hypothetical protein [Myxococcales bacterium]